MVNASVCLTDFDCPIAGSICYKDVTWFDYTGYPQGSGACFCNSFYSFEGPTCENFGSTAWFLFIAISIETIIASALAVWGWYDLARVLVAFEFNWKKIPRAAFVTILSTTLGLSFYVPYRLMILVSTARPDEFNRSFPGIDEKLAMNAILMRPFLLLTLIFGVITMLNVSVMWIEVGWRAANMRQSTTSVKHYKRAVEVVEVLFFIAVGIPGILGKFNLATLVSYPFMIGILITFIVGRMRMVKILKDALTFHASSSNTGTGEGEGQTDSSNQKKKRKEKNAYERTRRTMVAIKRCSTNIMIGIVGILFFGLLYFLFDTNIIKKGGFREWCEVGGGFCFVALINSALIWSILYVLITAFGYAHRSIKKLIRREQGIQGTSTASKTNDDDDETNSKTGSRAPLTSFSMLQSSTNPNFDEDTV